MSDDQRQLLIVRQSSLDRALEYFRDCGKCPTPIELMRTAELFKDFVYNGTPQDVRDRASNLERRLGKWDEKR